MERVGFAFLFRSEWVKCLLGILLVDDVHWRRVYSRECGASRVNTSVAKLELKFGLRCRMEQYRTRCFWRDKQLRFLTGVKLRTFDIR